MPFISFSCLVVLAGTVPSKSGENEHPCSRFQRNSSQFFTIENDVYCGFVIYDFYYVEVHSFYACFIEFLS